MAEYSRHIDFEAVLNFRDLGGYQTRDGRQVAWRRIFRSGELHHMTEPDIIRFREEIKLSTVIDLRSTRRLERAGTGPLNGVGVKFYSVPFTIVEHDFSKANELFKDFTNSGEVYLYLIRQEEYGRNIVRALEIIANPENHPLLFHCNAGKDRSGILGGILLSVLDVIDEDIIEDYVMTAPYLKKFIERWDNDPETADVHNSLPPYQLRADPESMAFFLSGIRHEYGSARGYIEIQGAEKTLAKRLETALLV